MIYNVDFSIIVVNWNGEKFLKTCFDSLRRQKHKSFEVILVDNGSSDSSVSFVKQYYPEVKVISLSENFGFAKANNIGLANAQGKYVAVLNNDTETDPNWLKEVALAFESAPEAGFIASKVFFYNERNVIDSAGDSYSIAGVAHKIGHRKVDGPEFTSPRFVFGSSGSSAVYRSTALEEVGCFDEDFFHGQEDVDLSFRLQLKGYKCLFWPKAIVYHLVSATSKKLSDFFVYYGQRNIEYVYLKNFPFSFLWKYFFIHLFFMTGSLVFFFLKGKIRPFLAAKFTVLLKLNMLLKKRKIIQSSKSVSNQYISLIISKKWFADKLGKFRAEFEE